MEPSTEKWARIRAEAARIFPLPELSITLFYVLLAAVWSVGSDLAVDRATGDPDEALVLQSCLKGANFVLTSSGLLYLLMRRLYARRRAAERMIVDQAERFELVARASNDVLWDMDIDGETVWWNEGYSRLFGPATEGQRPTLDAWYDRIHPEDRPRVREGILSALAQGRNAWSQQYRLRRPDGSYAAVLGRAIVIRDSLGKPRRVAGGLTDETERVEATRELRLSRARLRALAARLQTLREDESGRIAREIHDELGQLLTALRLHLRWIEDHVEGGVPAASVHGVIDRVVECTEIADQVLRAVRRIATELRPSVLDSLGLLHAIRREVVQLERQTGIRCLLNLPAELPPLSSPVRTEVYRILQEALTNVVRHAQATEVRAGLRVEENRVVLEVSDNGRGVSRTAPSDSLSLGLLGMQERAANLNGTLTIRDGKTGGTVVELDFPLPRESHGGNVAPATFELPSLP